MDAATAYTPVAYGMPGNTFHMGYSEKPVYAALPGVSPGFQNPQGNRAHPDTVFVGGFATTTTEKDLRNFFEKYGDIKEVKLPIDEKGTSRGYGFIKFTTEEMATKILKIAESSGGKIELNGRRINVARAMRRAQQHAFSPADYLLATPSGHLVATTAMGGRYLYSPIPLTLAQSSNLNANGIPQAQMQFYNMANGALSMQQQQGQCSPYEVGGGDGTPSGRSIAEMHNQSFEQYQPLVTGTPSPPAYTSVVQQDAINNAQQLSAKEQPLTPITPSNANPFMLPQLSPCYAQMLPQTDMVHYSQMTSYPLVYALNNFQQYGLPGGFVLPMVQVPGNSGVNSLEVSYQQNYSEGAQRSFGSGEMPRSHFSRSGGMKAMGQNRYGQKNLSFTGGKKSPSKGTIRRQN